MNNHASIPVVILAGGLGTRLREETETKPKPMVEIGGLPILWHLIKYYSAFGFNEFVICLGYKGEKIKEFFLDYHAHRGSMTVDMQDGRVTMHNPVAHDPWKVHLLETGATSMTGGRIRRAAQFVGPRRFMATYGDGLSTVDLGALLKFHTDTDRIATISAVRPPARFGGLSLDGSAVTNFTEKPQVSEGWINGGFMVFEPSVANLLESDDTILERKPMETLASTGQLSAYSHDGFWQCMDTVRDLTLLRELWDGDKAPWKIWK
jgi:glucose-1-phosphate cytidylyltransferase